MFARGVQAAAEETVRVDAPLIVTIHAAMVALDAAVVALMAVAIPVTLAVLAHRRREYEQTDD